MGTFPSGCATKKTFSFLMTIASARLSVEAGRSFVSVSFRRSSLVSAACNNVPDQRGTVAGHMREKRSSERRLIFMEADSLGTNQSRSSSAPRGGSGSHVERSHRTQSVTRLVRILGATIANPTAPPGWKKPLPVPSSRWERHSHGRLCNEAKKMRRGHIVCSFVGQDARR